MKIIARSLVFLLTMQVTFANPALAQGGSGDDFVPWPWSKSEGVVTSENKILTKIDGIFLVNEIKTVSVDIFKTNPIGLAIYVKLTHPTKGFYDTKIVPVYYPAAGSIWPSDGYYDFVVYTRKRAGIVQPVLTEENVSEVFEIGSTESVRGVRVWSATNCVAAVVSGGFPAEKAQNCKVGVVE